MLTLHLKSIPRYRKLSFHITACCSRNIRALTGRCLPMAVQHIENHHRSFEWCHRWPPMTFPSPRMGVPYAPRYANGHISATGNPIHFMFGSRVGFSGSADWMALFSVTWNPSWRQAAILDNFEWPYLRKTAHSIHLQCILSAIFAMAHLSCFFIFFTFWYVWHRLSNCQLFLVHDKLYHIVSTSLSPSCHMVVGLCYNITAVTSV